MAVGVGVGALVAPGVGVPIWADDDVAGVIAELPAGYVPQPPSATALRMTAATIRGRTLVKRQGGQPVTDARLPAGPTYSCSRAILAQHRLYDRLDPRLMRSSDSAQ